MPINSNSLTKLFNLLKTELGYDPYEIVTNEYKTIYDENKKLMNYYYNNLKYNKKYQFLCYNGLVKVGVVKDKES